MLYEFKPAIKRGSKIRLALAGPPGSGKTYTSLRIARALGPNPGLIDTERRRALKYADEFSFLHLPIDTFDPAELVHMTIAAAQAGIDPLILDTWSPFWSGDNGMLAQVDTERSKFDGWKKMRPVERQMVDALLGYPGHVVVNLRVKMHYDTQRNDKGKMEPVKVGLRPEQRDGIEYEFDIFGDMDNGTLNVTKSMCKELTGAVIEHPTPELGETIAAWLDRDAVGEPLNPVTIRDWAMEDGRTPADLGEKYKALEDAGQLTAVIYGPDGESLVNIGSLLEHRGRQIKAEQKRLAAMAPKDLVGATA